MNYQYRHGTSMRAALVKLHAEGGVGRLYQGVGWALVQVPLARFGDTACNSGVLELSARRSACASFVSSSTGASSATVPAPYRGAQRGGTRR